MSLINDALKKAARQRAQEDHSLPPMPGGNRGSHYAHGSPKKTQTLILIGGAAVVLVVVSVVLTGIMMNKGTPAAAPAPLPVPSQQPAPVAAAPAAAKIVIQAPVVAVSLPQAAAAQPTPVPTAVPRPTPIPVPIVHEAAPPVTTSMPIVTADAPSDGVQTIIDNYHISGVRASGSGSKALVDGHVYKVNDIVDRSLGLRLVKVEEDRLTFVDRNGTTYVKMF